MQHANQLNHLHRIHGVITLLSEYRTNMEGVYSRFILRLTTLLALMIVTASLVCLLIGAQSSGGSISAFTTNAQETTDVWVMDVSRNQFIHLQVTGHENNIPVWSREERQIVYYPRTP